MSRPQPCMVTIAPSTVNPEKTLIPPLRFAIVEKHVYRGSYPRSINFLFLETLKLKTILSLTPAPLIEPVAEWCKERGIRMLHCPPDKSGKKSIPLSHHDAKVAIEVRCVALAPLLLLLLLLVLVKTKLFQSTQTDFFALLRLYSPLKTHPFMFTALTVARLLGL